MIRTRYDEYDETECKYRLFDDCRGYGIITGKFVSYNEYDDIWSDDNTWTTDCHRVRAHWSAMMTYDYYKEEHNLTSLLDECDVMVQKVEYGGELGAHYYNKHVNLASPYQDYTFDHSVYLDIVGHEWTHGVVHHASNLGAEGDYESVALNESFCDVMGKMVEYRVDKLSTPSLPWEKYILFESFAYDYPKGIRRSMSNPHDYIDSDTYGDENWYTDDPDEAYNIHYRWAGVQNKWFYLLALGGSGTNNHPSCPRSYSVTGIGTEKATNIAYQNILYELDIDAQFYDAREGSIAAASLLYGATSNEVDQVINAWEAVGVYDKPYKPAYELCGTISGQNDPITVFHFIETCVPDGTPAQKSLIKVRIESESEIELKAGRYIKLGMGFHAKRGCKFRASIESCSTMFGKTANANNNITVRQSAVSPAIVTIEHVAPNPTAGTVVVKYHLTLPVAHEVSLVDGFGRIHYKKRIHSGRFPNKAEIELDVSDCSSGMYSVIIRTPESFTSSRIGVVK